MKRRSFVHYFAIAPFLAFAADAHDAHAGDTWEMIGSRTVKAEGKPIKFIHRSGLGNASALRIEARSAPLWVESVRIVYRGGGVQVAPLGAAIAGDAAKTEITLSNAGDELRSIELIARRPADGEALPQVLIWANPRY
jgi:hypothetical protein